MRRQSFEGAGVPEIGKIFRKVREAGECALRSATGDLEHSENSPHEGQTCAAGVISHPRPQSSRPDDSPPSLRRPPPAGRNPHWQAPTCRTVSLRIPEPGPSPVNRGRDNSPGSGDRPDQGRQLPAPLRARPARPAPWEPRHAQGHHRTGHGGPYPTWRRT